MPPTRALAVLAAAASLSLLAACGDDGDEPAATDDQTQGEDDGGDGASGATGAGAITVEGAHGEAADIELPEGIEAPSELITADLVEGDGDEVPPGATVTVHYKGVLLDGTEFDASYGGAPVTFPLDGVIAGWTEGIPGMREGGRRLLVIPPELAYGPRGQGPIGPDETLVFVVDLVEVAGV